MSDTEYNYTYERLKEFEYITQLGIPALGTIISSYHNDMALLLHILIQKVKFLSDIHEEGQ